MSEGPYRVVEEEKALVIYGPESGTACSMFETKGVGPYDAEYRCGQLNSAFAAGAEKGLEQGRKEREDDVAMLTTTMLALAKYKAAWEALFGAARDSERNGTVWLLDLNILRNVAARHGLEGE